MLTVDSIIPFLIERRLLEVGDVLAHGFEAREQARRNLSLHVKPLRGGESGGFVIKQPDPGDPSTRETLMREAVFYNHVTRHRLLDDVHVGFRGFDLATGALVLDRLSSAVAYRDAIGDPEQLGASLGQQLALVHAIRSDVPIEIASTEPPWPLRLHQPTPSMFATLSVANLELVRWLQRHPEACEQLDALRTSWQPTALIHADMKSDNILVADGALKIIDWELAQLGDPAWDIGSVLHDSLVHWITTMPISVENMSSVDSLSALSMDRLHSLTLGFWTAYTASSNDASDETLRRSIAHCGARLIQSAYEMSVSAATLSNHALATLQLALNTLVAPDEVCTGLFGLPAGWLADELWALAGAR